MNHIFGIRILLNQKCCVLINHEWISIWIGNLKREKLWKKQQQHTNKRLIGSNQFNVTFTAQMHLDSFLANIYSAMHCSIGSCQKCANIQYYLFCSNNYVLLIFYRHCSSFQKLYSTAHYFCVFFLLICYIFRHFSFLFCTIWTVFALPY